MLTLRRSTSSNYRGVLQHGVNISDIENETRSHSLVWHRHVAAQRLMLEARERNLSMKSVVSERGHRKTKLEELGGLTRAPKF